ncbi:fas-associated death domain protein [Choristoneura fumiferana]|uniref:fas-associated death domain protein n=1 Tax=Choristoneura fumiferana TaxID=7141 RepID=UPI003D157404
MVRILYNPLYTDNSQRMVSPEYVKLKDLITLKVGMSEMHSSVIQAMKVLYKKQINSIRRFEQIETVGQLLKVLEKRDVLSEEDILPLKVLAQQLPYNTDILKDIAEYEESYAPRKPLNQYVVKKEQQVVEQNEPPAVVGKYSSFRDGLSDARRDRVIETVTEEIGPYWRNLARYLGIHEYKIDEIQCLSITQAEKAMQIMEIYRARADRQKWFFDLMDALEKAHRRDLSDTIKKIATMNI